MLKERKLMSFALQWTNFLPRLSIGYDARASCLVAFFLLLSPSISANGFKAHPIPNWVKPIDSVSEDKVDKETVRDGVAYLLLDRQWRVTDKTHSQYQRIVTKALNSSGVEEASQITIDFDPLYESVSLHKILVHRDGTVIDRFKRSQINIIQREEELDLKIYDGSKTMAIFIEDVRPDDQIEYSYTITGSNPVFSGHFSKMLQTRWSVPVGRLHYRLLWLSSKTLHIRNYRTEIEPKITSIGKFAEYIWQQDAVGTLVADADTPNWYDPYPSIHLSDIGEWRDVALWALPLYEPIVGTPAQEKILREINDMAHTPEQRLVAALRFVQNDIRYLGIEMGERSHKPNTPDLVLENRFGDCKDKSRLLVSLLRAMNIEADTALVHTDYGTRLKVSLPSPTLFNHAIVVAKIDGKNYWLDPTRTHQRGNLNHLYQPDYDYALVISETSSDIAKMSEDITAIHEKNVEETFNISQLNNVPTAYDVTTTHTGFYADSTRGQLAESNTKELQKQYLNYTANYYPTAQFTKNISVIDNDSKNTLTLRENYTIPNAWNETDDKRYLYIDFSPFLISDHVKGTASVRRSMPYAIPHPVRYRHVTHIMTPENSAFVAESHKVHDPAFVFSKNVRFSGDKLTIDYLFESKKDHVAPENITTYTENIHKALSLSNYQIEMPHPAINLGEYQFDPNDINWKILILAMGAFFVFFYLAQKYIYLRDPVHVQQEPIDQQLVGLKGWLILPGISVVLTPFGQLIWLAENLYIFSDTQWSILGDRFDPEFLTLIAAELLANMALFVASIYLLIMFFQRRNTFPRFFIAYYFVTLLLMGASLVTVHMFAIPGVDPETRELIRAAIFFVIWTSYFTVSKRVKATFTCRRKTSSDDKVHVDKEAQGSLRPNEG